MNIREAHREIWRQKLVGAEPASRQSIDRVTWTCELMPEGPGRLLDIGTGSGAMLARARRLGYEVSGVDFDAPLVEWLEFQDYDVHCVDVNSESLPFEPRSIDVVTCCDAIEHLIDPGHAVDEAKRVLKPGGRFYVSTPNYTHWRRVVDLAGGTHRGTSGDKTLLDGGHVSYWGAADLEEFLQKHGFMDVRIHWKVPSPAPAEIAAMLMRWAKQREWIDHAYQIAEARKP